MKRTAVVLLALVVLVSPVWSEDAERDCSVWQIEGVGPGMTLEEVNSGERKFNEQTKYRDGSGYRRYTWHAPGSLEKIELHVDAKEDTQRLIGVTRAIPAKGFNVTEFKGKLFAAWGEPTDVSRQGAFSLYSWVDEQCDVAVRASVMNQTHDVAVFMSLANLSARDKLARRRKGTKKSEED